MMGPLLGAGLSALEGFFNPAAERARELLNAEHERVLTKPSPGDKLLTEGLVIIPTWVRRGYVPPGG